MARAPRAKVSATSGQGISRLAYQKAYAMKGGLTSKFTGAKSSTPPRDYAKKGMDEMSEKFRAGGNALYVPEKAAD